MRWIFFIVLFQMACSSAPYKRQEYATLSNTKVFEEEIPVVWKSILNAIQEYRLKEKDSEKGIVQTDWIYSTSNDKYVEYKVNGFPRKHYLQTRYKFVVNTEKQQGGVKVTVDSTEEIENTKSDGSFDSWNTVSDSDKDTSRTNELLRNIELKILSR